MLRLSYLGILLWMMMLGLACKEEWLNDNSEIEIVAGQTELYQTEVPSQDLFWFTEEMPYLLECAYIDDRNERKKCTDQKVLETIYGNFRYPIGGDFCIEGMIVVRFVIEEDGSMKGLEIARGIHPLFDEEALRVVRLLPPFIPGKIGGKPVAIQYNLPVRIRLE